MRLLSLFLVAALAHAESIQLDDGRVLHGKRVHRGQKIVVLETDFGPLSIPKERLGVSGTVVRKPPPKRREIKTRWLLIECDLSEARARLYADQLDAFFDWMIRVYDLDLKRVRRDAPYKMFLYRRRADFKKVQAEVAPAIERKGKGFAEGVAGFYSSAAGAIYMWDAEGGRGGVHLGVAKHETTHLLNHLMSRQFSLRIPNWFEEGAATYFSMYIALGGKTTSEPDDHPGALAQVVGEIEGGKPMTSRALREVAWEDFLGRQYSWGWGLVRFFRHHRSGRRWPHLLKHLRTIGRSGVTDSEERRFLKAVGFKSSDALDKAWHQHLLGAKPKDDTPVGTSPAVLKRIAAITKPAADVARNFARIGISLARAHEAQPAIVYLRAALRGGVKDAEVYYQLAASLARQQGGARWPDEAVDALNKAVGRAPLRAAYRLMLGRQLLQRQEIRDARDMLGLALVLAGEDDDEIALAVALLGAAATLESDKPIADVVTTLAKSVPPAEPALRMAHVYYLQEAEEWGELAALLEGRTKDGSATFEERAMLAGLYKATDELDEALAIYTTLLREQPSALQLWPDRIECLIGLGRKADAREALQEALQAIRDDPRELGWVRRRLER
ncbi:MAG: tetratricopeptide repeat protein, partial [Planctomycetota bacterium]